MGFFGAAHGWGVAKRPSLPKICHTYQRMMKLGTVIPCPKKIQKIDESRDTPLEFGNSSMCIREVIITSIL